MKIERTTYAISLPIVYLFLVILVFGENINWFYGLSMALVIAEISLLVKIKFTRYHTLAYAILILGSIGLAASTLLVFEKLALLEDPNYITSCSVSPVVSCNNVISSDQASVVNDIPNPLFGVFGFSVMIAAGMTIIAGAKKLHRLYWLALLGGATLGSIFSVWLIFQGLYSIGALCLYCMAVWYVSFTSFWYTLDFVIKEKIINLPDKLAGFLIKYRNMLITASIGIVVLLIYFRWIEYWNGLL